MKSTIIAILFACAAMTASAQDFHEHSAEQCAAFGQYAEGLQSGRELAPTLSKAMSMVKAGLSRDVKAGKKTQEQADAQWLRFSGAASVVYRFPAGMAPSEMNDKATMLCLTDSLSPEMLAGF